MTRPLSLMELSELEQQVSAAVGCDVDLVPESAVRPDLRAAHVELAQQHAAADPTRTTSRTACRPPDTLRADPSDTNIQTALEHVP